MKPEVGLHARPAGLESSPEFDVAPLEGLLADAGAALRPLFDAPEERLRAEVAALSAGAEAGVPDLSLFYTAVPAPAGDVWAAPADGLAARLDELAGQLQELEAVEAVYLKPPALPPLWAGEGPPETAEPPAQTPDLTAGQGYLDPAPGGIDARHAWTLPGGRGEGVRIIDIEGDWRFTHEDLRQNQGGIVGGTPPPANVRLGWRNHGTAVIGEFGGDDNGFGITGISPAANVRAVSIFGIGSAAAIKKAADLLGPGDLILIELHRPGPRHNFDPRIDPRTGTSDQLGYVAVEWWPDDYAAIRYTVGRGVIVVAAAGNGAENLDDVLYDANPAFPHGPFPSWWRNPFRRNPLDSGSILVGAGAPPPGTHGRNHGPDRSRLAFSNYGTPVDVQGWGREVTTTGYGTMPGHGGSDEDRWYTDTFSGTSSASPIIVGALACVQGARRARQLPLLTPPEARQTLRETGSPQQDAPGRLRTQRIGNRPDLRQLIDEEIPGPWNVKHTEVMPARASVTWVSRGWPPTKRVVWRVVPKATQEVSPLITWDVEQEQAANGKITYWIFGTNHGSSAVEVDIQFKVTGGR
jgi:hypothetical protein